MPRELREFEVGNIYHILNRGVEKRRIFEKDQDYSRFILGLEFFNSENPMNIWQLVARADSSALEAQSMRERLEQERAQKRKPVVELLAFALMPNHYHLIVREISDGGISLFMKKLGGYSTYFNKRYERVGPLFQSRFKAVAIMNDQQLANVFAYVHTNPVELIEPGWKLFQVRNAKQAKAWLATYRWSSYLDYIGKVNFPYVTRRVFFKKLYGQADGCRRMVEEWIEFKAVNAELGNEILE